LLFIPREEQRRVNHSQQQVDMVSKDIIARFTVACNQQTIGAEQPVCKLADQEEAHRSKTRGGTKQHSKHVRKL
jgi:hypothetical protein